jgi:hypothetical protein
MSEIDVVEVAYESRRIILSKMLEVGRICNSRFRRLGNTIPLFFEPMQILA